MQLPEPQAEHLWLKKLLGEWTFEADGPPDQPKFTGTETVRPLGELWTIGEGQGEMPGGGPARMITTLGYDAARGRFVGTWVGSMMTHLWVYEGSLNAEKTILTLDSEGPSFAGDGTLAKYQDIVEILSDDHRTLSSQFQQADGSWNKFMTMHLHRKK